MELDDQMIEGIGNDLLAGLSLLVVALIPLLMAFIVNRSNRTIHPDNQARVDTARQRLRVNQTEEETEDVQENGQGEATERAPRQVNRDAQCPICLVEQMNFATETNCGHVFCANCLITYWRYGAWLGAIQCPVCRQIVTILFPCFRDNENGGDGHAAIMQEINDYNRRFSGEPRPLMDYLRDLPTLLRHLVIEMFSPSGLVWMFRLRIFVCFIAATLYLLMPLDVIPEAVFGVIGLFDDVLIILVLGIYVTVIYRGIIADRGG
ncbi:E3 ubiquitin-protein ligase RNF170-like [Anneissia japonica]|uniref:E3 ubiquitin-protein ligase RNF170-like n=1 Tax=Anneissia japonica TaxID=1529436 RepID=UPI0014256F6D|nr:E3 ubiquitin-protein ligase RNF170-like [Anneissia japonica]